MCILRACSDREGRRGQSQTVPEDDRKVAGTPGSSPRSWLLSFLIFSCWISDGTIRKRAQTRMTYGLLVHHVQAKALSQVASSWSGSGAAYVHTYIHACMHACTHAYTQVCTLA